MEIPAHLLSTSVAGDQMFKVRHEKISHQTEKPVDELDPQELNQLATHLPDVILNMNIGVKPPFVRQYSGVIMFLDISGFTDLSEKCSASGSSGADTLTAILNDYMGSMIEEVLKIKGDVLKFAGDAILVFWKVENYDHLMKLVKAVIECSCNIQTQYGVYNAEGLTTLRVKIALSLGRMYFFVFGNDTHYFYCESGAAVKDAKDAEHLSKSGDVIVSPYMWSYCDENDYVFTKLSDEQHVKVSAIATKEVEKLYQSEIRNNPKGSSNKLSKLSASEEPDIVGTFTSSGIVYRKTVFDTGAHLNQALSKYVTETVLDKLEAGHGIEHQSEIRSCTIAFINLELTSDNLKASKQCDILQKAYEAIAQQLETYKASLNKAVMFDKGCSFLIIFGLPGKKDSYECKHAVHCAWKIRSTLQELAEVAVASAGVTTGYTFCGVVGHEHRHEYTVIGRTVNMAARLMMYYPGIVSCDNETYTQSRLRQHHFRSVSVKEMKGLKDVGVIREYTEDASHISFVAPPLPEFKRPIAARDRELENYSSFIEEFQNSVDTNQSAKNFLIYEGAPESGKSRLLSEVTMLEKKKDIHVVVSLGLTSNDFNRPYFVTRSIISSLLNLSYEEGKWESRARILEQFLSQSKEYSDKEITSILKILNDLFLLKGDTHEGRVDPLPSTDDDVDEVVLQVLSNILDLIIKTEKRRCVLVIDDTEFIDSTSWKLIESFKGSRDIAMVLSILNMEKSSSHVSFLEKLIESDCTCQCRVESIPSEMLAVVACQLLNVSAIPVEIEQLINQKTQGMPGYVRYILTDLLTTGALQIVSVLLYQTDYDDYIWPDFEQITGQPTQLSRKRSMLRSRNKWTFHSQLPEQRDSAEDRIAIITPGSNFVPSLYKTPNTLKGQLLIEFDQITLSEQMVLKCASVIGVVSSTQVLHVLWPFPPASLTSALCSLFVKDFIRCYTATQEATGKDMYNNCLCKQSGGIENCKIITFSNHLMRDTVYSMLLEDQRTDMHHKVAKYMESMVGHADEDTIREFLYQELPFFVDDMTNLFVDCKVVSPADRSDLAYPNCRPSLYCYTRLKSCLQSYVADEDGGFCSQKLLDWLMEYNEMDDHESKEKREHNSVISKQNTDDLLKSVAKQLNNKKPSFLKSREVKKSLKNKAQKMRQRLTRSNSVGNFVSMRGSMSAAQRRSSVGSRSGSARNPGRPRLKSQNMTAMSGVRRRNASADGSMSGDRLSGKFSLPFNQIQNQTECEKDCLQSRRESNIASEIMKRPIIGRSGLTSEQKFSLFRQTIWHWKSALNLKNVLFTMVEAGCVALQDSMFYQAYLYLKYSYLFTEKVKEKINPLTGDSLGDQSQTMLEFWKHHNTKLAHLIALIHHSVEERPEASSLYSACLEVLDFKVPETDLKLLLITLRQSITTFLSASRECLPAAFKEFKRPTEYSKKVEICRIISSIYFCEASKIPNDLLMNMSLSICKDVSNCFEMIIVFSSLVDYYQRNGKISAAQHVISKAFQYEQKMKSNLTKEERQHLLTAELLYQCTVLHCFICQAVNQSVFEKVDLVKTLVQEMHDEMVNIYIVPLHYQALFLSGSSTVEQRAALVKKLELVDDLTYYSCLWDEFLIAGMQCNSIVSKTTHDLMVSFTQELLSLQLDYFTEHGDTTPDLDHHENNILGTFALFMVYTNGFVNANEMQNALALLENIQPECLNTYWKIHAFAKLCMACLLSLEIVKKTDVMNQMVTRMIKRLSVATHVAPIFIPTCNRLSRIHAVWIKDGVIDKKLLFEPYFLSETSTAASRQ